MKLQKFDRVKQKEGVMWCYCSAHKDWHPCSDFNKTTFNHGYQYCCKEHSKRYLIERMSENPKDLDIAHNMLKRMGYTVPSEQSIHEQFLKKFQL